MLVRARDAQRIGEIKVPAGSVAIDSAGRLWTADVAGHIACYEMRGRKLFDVKGTSDPAVPDAVLPPGSPLPVILRGSGGIQAVFTLRKTRCLLTADGLGQPAQIPPGADGLWKILP